jgi:hypothetical protein
MFLPCFVYGSLGILLQSSTIWLFCLFSLGNWLGLSTAYFSGYGAYAICMNNPLSFVFFGAFLIGISLVFLEKHERFYFLFRVTLIVGLIYHFLGLWFLSIFGNYFDIFNQKSPTHFELFIWCTYFSLSGSASIIHGIRSNNSLTRRFGIVFLMINLYTRLFEWFWQPLDKALFFGLLGIIFWLFAHFSEKVLLSKKVVQIYRRQ